jgi:2-amino-4-hydroxy-6-hydroxymethyldihydropteridine diphosphokinase
LSVYLSFGSNVGNRFKNIQRAIKLLEEIGFDIIKTSSLYETAPWPIRDKSLNGLKGKKEQPHFLNLVIKGKTKLSPEKLLEEIKKIETTIGRKPARKWGPREIDIDILFYKKEIINTPSLVIPHPQLHKRAFVLIPLKEISPRLIHPLIKKTVSQMLNDLNDNGSVVLYNKSAKEKIRL